MKRKVVLAFLLTGALVLSGCSKTNNSNETSSGSTSTDSSAQGIDVSNMFSDRDKEIGYDEENSTVIKLSDDSTTCDSDAVQISGNTVTIIDEGTYILSGTLTDGMVIVDAEDTDKVQLVLDGVDITSAESAAIYVREADKVFITTASDSQNTLTNGGTYTAIDDNNIDAAIFSKSDLTLNGAGSLTITAKAGHGVVSKDDLVLTSRTYQIDAASHGLSGKDSVRIASGSYTIVSGKDGIHAENADDTSLGFVYLADGTFDITSGGDGISAGNWLQADGGVYTVKAGGGSENVQKSDGEWQFGPGQQTESTDTTEEDTVSMKAIKAAGELILKGGKYSLDSADDTIHSNANITISDGEFTLASGDDGIHADSATTISGGTIDITESYEGIEGLSIDITGGETYVSGPTNDGNSALDYNGTGTVTGGIFIAAGSSGMAENFGDSSTQGVMMVTVNSQAAGSAVSLSDSSGNELVSWTPEKEYTSVIISCPEITTGQEYTLTTGSDTTQITMDSIVYGSGSGMGGNPGNGGGPGNGGDMGQKPDDGNGMGKGSGDGGNMGTPPEKS
ncbi:carbohydrate-binding domain-containing protein [Tyzzerella nexilis]|nr:carbohydrate-binding domain-containing protein [[Clostridium] nexile]